MLIRTTTPSLREALDEAFALYIHELTGRAGLLGTLHLGCAIPDVCGALESSSGESTGAAYVAWANRHLVKGDTVMTAADWYKLRCSILHQGSSLPTDPKGRMRSQYGSVSFVVPGDADPTTHRVVLDKQSGKNITLYIPALADEMLAALRDWFDWLASPDADHVRKHVQSHLRTVVSPRPKMWPDHPVEGITWSSSGATYITTIDFP